MRTLGISEDALFLVALKGPNAASRNAEYWYEEELLLVLSSTSETPQLVIVLAKLSGK